MEIISLVSRWVIERWNLASGLLRTLYIFGLLILLVLVIGVPFFASPMGELLTKIHPSAQAIIFILLLSGFLLSWYFGLDKARRLDELKTTRTQLELQLAAEKIEVCRLQEQMDNLVKVECRHELWRRKPGLIPPPFVPKHARRTRFVTVLNLKGGVAKTTLTSNLAACLARSEKPLRVLVIDIDFQGTLSRATVERSLLENQLKHEMLVNRLLLSQQAEEHLVDRVSIAMKGMQEKHARVIIADENLEPVEFQLQSQFFVDNSSDPRFQFRLHLHQSDVLDAFDLVLFDCPPRITASVVNAVACSDYILIPTKLNRGDIDAIPRTVSWMKCLGEICRAEVLGVIASHVSIRSGKPIKADGVNYEYLKKVVQSECGSNDLVFQAMVPLSNNAVNGDGVVACESEEGRKLFSQVVKELRERLRQ